MDMSNIAFSTALKYHSMTGEQVTDDLLRHLVLTKIINLKTILKKYDDGKIILCFDASHYWRKDEFPNYKKSRKDKREESSFDWNNFFITWNNIYHEFKDNLPYYSLKVDNAEGDDIIYTMCILYHHDHDIVIASSDEDGLQILQLLPKVKQYSIKHKKFIDLSSQSYNLFEHIVKGDASDGIPNILSGINHFVENTGGKQKSITQKMINEWKKSDITDPENFCDSYDMLERYKQNKKLIDMSEMPDEIFNAIKEQYNNYNMAKGLAYKYCVKHKLAKILQGGKL